MHVFSSDTVKRGGRRRSRSYSLVKKSNASTVSRQPETLTFFAPFFFLPHTKKHRRLFRRKKTTVSPSPPSDPFFESITRPREKSLLSKGASIRYLFSSCLSVDCLFREKGSKKEEKLKRAEGRERDIWPPQAL